MKLGERGSVMGTFHMNRLTVKLKQEKGPAHSVVDVDPVGSETFIRIRVRKNN